MSISPRAFRRRIVRCWHPSWLSSNRAWKAAGGGVVWYTPSCTVLNSLRLSEATEPSLSREGRGTSTGCCCCSPAGRSPRVCVTAVLAVCVVCCAACFCPGAISVHIIRGCLPCRCPAGHAELLLFVLFSQGREPNQLSDTTVH